MPMKNAFLFFFLSVLSFSLHAQESLTDKNYRVFDNKAQKEVSIDDIANAMQNYDVLFFGEEHNDSVSHYLEYKIFSLLSAKYNQKIALSMEMFDRDVQPVMDEYLAGFIREKNFKKDARAWSNYRDYRPMVELAKEKKLDVICANAPSRYTNMAGRLGQSELLKLPKQALNWMAPLPYDTATGPYYEKLTGVSLHTTPAKNDTSLKKMPVMAMGNFNLVTAQSLWDATMAYSIASHLKKHKEIKIFQVNGRFHSDEGFAIVTQLKKYLPSAKTLVISSSSDEKFPNINWIDYKGMGDYVIITDPAIPRTYKE